MHVAVFTAQRRLALAILRRTASSSRRIPVLCIIVKVSRVERPQGSLPAFAWSDLAKGSTPIHSITERHSLSPSSSTCTAIDLPYGLSSQWERYGFTVFRLSARVG